MMILSIEDTVILYLWVLAVAAVVWAGYWLKNKIAAFIRSRRENL